MAGFNGRAAPWGLSQCIGKLSSDRCGAAQFRRVKSAPVLGLVPHLEEVQSVVVHESVVPEVHLLDTEEDIGPKHG